MQVTRVTAEEDPREPLHGSGFALFTFSDVPRRGAVPPAGLEMKTPALNVAFEHAA